MKIQGGQEPLSVDWSQHESFALVTGMKDGPVQIWDTRKASEALKSLLSHGGEVVRVEWSPPGDAIDGIDRRHFLASAASDGKAILWNLANEETQDEQARELLFVHSGHQKAVNDFAWGLLDDFLFCSVGEDHLLQLWQPAVSLFEEDLESAPKRPRTAETPTESL